jgi:putative flippase GtrA
MKIISDQFIKYCIVGLNNVFVAYSVFYVLLEFFGVNYMLAGALGFAAAIFPAFWLNRTWTFKSGISVKAGLPRYTASTLFIFAIHSSTQWLSTEVFLVPEVLSQLVGICVTTIINFLVVRRFVFS